MTSHPISPPTPHAESEGLLREAAENLLHSACHARVFITSREKMHPIGVELYNADIAKLEAALDALSLRPPPAPEREDEAAKPKLGVWKTTTLRTGQPDLVQWRAWSSLRGEVGMFETEAEAWAALGPPPAETLMSALIGLVRAVEEETDIDAALHEAKEALDSPAVPAPPALADGEKGALRDALARDISCPSMSLDEFRYWATNGTTYPNAYKSLVDEAFARADRVLAAGWSLLAPPAAPKAESAPSAGVGDDRGEVWTLGRAFELGYQWAWDVSRPQSREDSRAIGRTIQSDAFEGLDIRVGEFNSFQSADVGIVACKAIIHDALRRAEAAPALLAERDALRVERDEAREIAANFTQVERYTCMRAQRETALAELEEAKRRERTTLNALRLAHEVVWEHRDLKSPGTTIVGNRAYEAVKVAIATLSALSSAKGVGG